MVWASRGFVLALVLTVVPLPVVGQAFEPSMANWLLNIQRAVSSIRVDTRQDSVVGEQNSNATQNAFMGLAGTIVEQETAIRIREAVARFESMHNDLTTGLCTVAQTQRSANDASEAIANLNSELAGFEERWLERGGDRLDTLIATHRMRRTVLCTNSEAEAGLCEGSPAFGVPPAADSNAAPFLIRREYGSAEVDAGSIFVDTVAPFPTIQAADEAVSASELIERANARRELALVSLARFGLTDVLLRGVEGGVFRMKRNLFWLTFVIGLCTGSTVLAQACTGVEARVNARTSTLTATLTTQITARTAAIVTQETLQRQQLLSALRVMVRQESLSNEQEVNADHAAQMAMSNVIVEDSVARQTHEAVTQYGSTGHAACDLVDAGDAVADMMTTYATTREAMAENGSGGPGRRQRRRVPRANGKLGESRARGR